VTLPNNLAEYEIKQGNPETQFGFNTNYTMDNGFGFTLSGNAFSSTYSGRLKLVKLPAVETMNLGAFYKADYWQLKLDIKNVFDTEYFRARTGDTLGETLVQAMPGRTMSATFNVVF
jgi:outer membrane receptor protein involved in Fe transport